MKSLFHRKLHIYTSYELSYEPTHEFVILPMKLHRKLHTNIAPPGFRKYLDLIVLSFIPKRS